MFLLVLLACASPPPCDAVTFHLDEDGDGYAGAASTQSCTEPNSWSAIQGDCDDADPTVHPGAAEVWYDGVDQGCDGGEDGDADGDGYNAVAVGGDDCDDTDPAINPGAEEVCGNGVDEDCREAEGGDCPLATIMTTNLADITVRGSTTDQRMGHDVQLASDLDANGRNDVVVVSVHYDATSSTLAGAVSLVEALPDGSAVTTVVRGDPGPIGPSRTHTDIDFDRDGRPDMLVLHNHAGIGEMARLNQPSMLTVFLTPVGPGLQVDDADAQLTSAGEGATAFGVAVTRLGPTDAPDSFAISSAAETVGGAGDAGRVYKVTAGSLGVTRLDADVAGIYCDQANCGTGMALASIDVDGDGQLDLIASTRSYVVDGSSHGPSGTITTHLGPLDELAHLDDADAILLADGTDFDGGALDGSSDLDGDGQADLVVSAPGAETEGGAAGFVALLPATALRSSGSILDGALARIEGRSMPGEFGYIVSTGTVDGDAHSDLLVAASQLSVSDAIDDGEGWSTLLFFGPLEGVVAEEDAAVAFPVYDSSGDLVYGIATGQDISGDGCDDIAIGVPDNGADEGRGAVYITFGGCY